MKTLEEAIKSLGDSYETAIEVLKASGVKGVIDDNCNCVVARYLTKQVGQSISVGPTMTDEVYSAALLQGRGMFNLPSHVTRIIKQFDACELPDLEGKKGLRKVHG